MVKRSGGEDPKQRIGMVRSSDRRRAATTEGGRDLLNDVFEPRGELRALLDQSMGAGGERRVDAARHREHLPSIVEREPSRDERAAPLRRFDDHRAVRHAGNDAIAGGKVFRPRRRTDGPLTDETTGLREALRELPVLGRIDDVDPRAEYCDRVSTGAERALMRRRVDAAGKATHDRDPCAREILGEPRRDILPVAGRVSRTDHGDPRRIDLDLPARDHIERRVGQVAQQTWILERGAGDDARPPPGRARPRPSPLRVRSRQARQSASA